MDHMSHPHTKEQIIGSFEAVTLPDGRIILAKIDTGAYSSSVHCDSITERNENGKSVLYFKFTDEMSVPLKVDDFRKITVRSSNGQTNERYAVALTIGLGSNSYTTIVTLSKRHTMQYPMLLGKRFLRENGFLVDVSKTYLLSEKREEG